jgi:hypothetical protein
MRTRGNVETEELKAQLTSRGGDVNFRQYSEDETSMRTACAPFENCKIYSDSETSS